VTDYKICDDSMDELGKYNY